MHDFLRGGGFKSTKGFVLLLFYLILLKSIDENEKIVTQREVEFIYEGRRKC